MKISKRRIKQLISESLEKVLREDTGDTGDTGYDDDTGDTGEKISQSKSSSAITNLMYAPNQPTMKPIKLWNSDCVFSSKPKESDIKKLRKHYKEGRVIFYLHDIGNYVFGNPDSWPSVSYEESSKMGQGQLPFKKIKVDKGGKELKVNVLPEAWSVSAAIFLEDYNNLIKDLVKYIGQQDKKLSNEEKEKQLKKYVFQEHGVRLKDMAQMKQQADHLSNAMKEIELDNLDYDPSKDN